MIVADTNLIAYLLLPGERTEQARAVMLADSAWVAPPLWQSELRSVLSKEVRRGGMALTEARKVLGLAVELFSAGECPVEGGMVLDLAAESGCSAYDCEFVALALELGVTLVTGDEQVRKAFPGIAVGMEEFQGG